MAQRETVEHQLKYTKENSTVASVVLFIVFFGLFLGGFFAFSFASLDNAWPFAVGIAMITVAFGAPLALLGRADSANEMMVDTEHRKPSQGH